MNFKNLFKLHKTDLDTNINDPVDLYQPQFKSLAAYSANKNVPIEVIYDKQAVPTPAMFANISRYIGGANWLDNALRQILDHSAVSELCNEFVAGKRLLVMTTELYYAVNKDILDAAKAESHLFAGESEMVFFPEETFSQFGLEDGFLITLVPDEKVPAFYQPFQLVYKELDMSDRIARPDHEHFINLINASFNPTYHDSRPVMYMCFVPNQQINKVTP